MIKILVTGAAGNVGSALVNRLVENRECFVTGMDNFLTGSPKKLPDPSHKNFGFVEGDVNDLNQIGDVMKDGFDFVFHYAAVVGVQRTLNNPVMVLDDIKGIKNVADLSRDTGVKRIFFSSSSEVYGEPVEFPQNEHTTPLNSRLPYAIVKNLGESFLKAYHKEYGLSFTIFRFFNTYGPRQSEDFVMSRFIRLALDNKDITIYGDGLQTRTFCFIDDNIDTVLNCLWQDKCVNDVMNVGNDQEMTILSLAEKVIEGTGSGSRIKHLPALEEGDMRRRSPDITKMRKILNRPLTPVEEGLRLTIKNRMF